MAEPSFSYDDIAIGDWVEHRANSNVFGVVIGREGSLLLVRLAASLIIAKFHDFEMRVGDEDERGDFEMGAADGDEYAGGVSDNVVSLADVGAKLAPE